MGAKHELDFLGSRQEPLMTTDLSPLELFHRGKVRDTYYLGDWLLVVTTDRISAFDVVLPTGIPDKGWVLNMLSAFWFEKTRHIIPNHLETVVEGSGQLANFGRLPDYLNYRSMIVRPADRIDVECVVRGYLSGSAWAEYSRYGTIHGQPMPPDLKESDQLPEPIFTPTTKAETGHDEPVSFSDLVNQVGSELAEKLKEKSMAVYQFAQEYALSRGIIIADTKMEFGLIDGHLALIDELLTPDSSRFWPAATYSPGRSQPSFDKQYVRDWLVAVRWNKEPPAPYLPPDVVRHTAEKYREAYRQIVT